MHPPWQQQGAAGCAGQVRACMPQCLPAIFRGCCLHQIGSVRRLADRKFASAAVAFRGGPSPHTAGRPRRVQPAPPSPAFVDVSSSVRLGDPSWDSAVLLVDKPLGWTSQDVCSKLRGVLKAKKVCAAQPSAQVSTAPRGSRCSTGRSCWNAGPQRERSAHCPRRPSHQASRQLPGPGEGLLR